MIYIAGLPSVTGRHTRVKSESQRAHASVAVGMHNIEVRKAACREVTKCNKMRGSHSLFLPIREMRLDVADTRYSTTLQIKGR